MSEIVFRDNLAFDQTNKTVVSIRDGILEYYGQELGLQPANKIFKVYRTPATIASLADALVGIPVIFDHSTEGDEVNETDKVGSVETSKVVDLIDESTVSHLGIQNKILLDNNALTVVQSGKNNISLGYKAKLIPSDMDGVDFEHRDIVPIEMSIVDIGRCGNSCSFKDRAFTGEVKDMALLTCFKDEDGNPNLAQIVEIATGLPDAIKTIPVSELQKVLPMLQDIVNMAQGNSEKEAESEAGSDDDSADPAVAKSDVEDEGEDKDMDKDDKDAEKKIADSVKLQLDSKLKAAVNNHTNVLLKSKDFLDSKYDYANKSTEQIMKDVVSTQYEDCASMSRDQLDMAFKLVKKPAHVYKDFSVSNPITSKFDAMLAKEI